MADVKISTINIPTACEQLGEPGALCFKVQESALKGSRMFRMVVACHSDHSSIHSGHSINADYCSLLSSGCTVPKTFQTDGDNNLCLKLVSKEGNF